MKAFIYSNFGNVDVACLDIVSTLKEKDWKVGINLPDVCGYKLPSGEIASAKKDSGNQRIHYGRAATTLVNKIKEIRTKNVFNILFDELDEDYQVDKQYFHLLISLFKAAYQFKQEISRGGPDIRPIVVLREDIYGQLDDHDLNKLDDSTVRLNWQRHTSNPSDISLRGLVNERIRANFGAQTISDYWASIVDEELWGGPTESAWDFILNRTMDRPRDLIKFLKIAQNFEKREKLSPHAVRLTIDDYSRWFYNEIGNEIFRFLPDYREALGLLTRIGKGLFTIDAWRREFGKEKKLKDLYNPDSVLRILYDFSIVGMIKGKRWLFRYKMPQITFDIGARYCVHFGIQKHLVILGSLPYAKKKK